MDLLATTAGVLLIAFLARDVVLTLFHRDGHGALGRWVQRAVWAVARGLARRHGTTLTAAGPAIILLVLASWLTLAVLGWALLYWPALPEGFILAPGLDPQQHDGFLDAVYHSLVALTTLGYGDLAPAAGWLRIVAPLQALVGFGLLTATISWVLSIYPALTRIRTLAAEVATLAEAEGGPEGAGVDALSSAARRDLLRDLEERVGAVHADLTQFPVAYYFETADPRHSLARALPALFGEAERAAGAADRDVRFAGRRLTIALERLVGLIGRDLQRRPDDPPAVVVERLRAERAPSHRRADGRESRA